MSPSSLLKLQQLPGLFDPALSTKVLGVAEKYQEQALTRIPEFTEPDSTNHAYQLTEAAFWTGGFFPGTIWLLVERQLLLPSSVPGDKVKIIALARKWQEGLKPFAYPASDHDQGFRFQPSFTREWELLGVQESKDITLLAARSLAERFNEVVGATRSWDRLPYKAAKYNADDQEAHFLVIMDNLMNLDLLFKSSELTGDPKYAQMAARHAETTMKSHIRPEFSTYHVVDFHPKTGEIQRRFQFQGWQDESTWSRGQAWGIYGFSQTAKSTGRADFLAMARNLADTFLGLLAPDGVPHWDFDHPRPTARDASAGMIAAGGLLKIYSLLRKSEPEAAEEYLRRAHKLVEDTIKMCMTPRATRNSDGTVDFGAGGWETLLMHSSINGHQDAPRRSLDHGLVYADYYFLEFGNEVLKLRKSEGNEVA